MIRGIGVLSDIDLFSNFKCAKKPCLAQSEGRKDKNLGTKWAFFGKRSRRCGMNRLGICGVKTFGLILDTWKGCWWIKTVWRWSWKSTPA